MVWLVKCFATQVVICAASPVPPRSWPGSASRSSGSCARTRASRTGRGRAPAAHVMNRSWVSPPICTSTTCVNPAASSSRSPATWRSTSGPHGICALTILLAHRLGCRIELLRNWQLGVHSPSAGEPAELIPPHCDLLIGSYDNAIWPMRGFSGAPRVVEHLAKLGTGLGGDHGVGVPSRQTTAGRPRYRDADRRGGVRQVPDLRGFDIEMLAPVRSPCRPPTAP
jgi:hypothetical protein